MFCQFVFCLGVKDEEIAFRQSDSLIHSDFWLESVWILLCYGNWL